MSVTRKRDPSAFEAFGRALRHARNVQGLSQVAVADHVKATFGWSSQATIVQWELAKGRPPDPPVVFELERFLRRPAGSLSVHFGYVPVAMLKYSSVAQAIIVDQSLTTDDKVLLQRFYESLKHPPSP